MRVMKNPAEGEHLRRLAARLPRGTRDPGSGLASAHWSDPIEVIDNGWYDMETKGHQVLLGRYGHQLISTDTDSLITLCANPRAGKGVSFINPLLMTYTGSMFVWDFKGELAPLTAARREEMGQQVVILDASNQMPEHCHQYRSSLNPLSMVPPPDSRNFVSQCGLVASALVERGAESDPFWNNSAVSWLQTIIMHILTDPYYTGQQNLLTVRDLLIGGVTLPDMVDEDGKPVTGQKGLQTDMAANEALGGMVQRRAASFYDMPDNTRGSIIQTADVSTAWLDYGMRDILLDPDDPAKAFNFRDLKTSEKGLTVYLSLSISDMENAMGWLRLITRLALSIMEDEKTKPDAMPIFLMDEFAAAGYQKAIELYSAFSIGVRLIPVIQTISQLKQLYKNNWSTFLTGVFISFGCSDNETTEWVQKRLGRTSLQVTNTGTNEGMNQSEGTTEGETDGSTSGGSRNMVQVALSAEKGSDSFGSSQGRSVGRSATTGQSSGSSESLNWQETDLLSGAEFAKNFSPHYPGNDDRLMLVLLAGEDPIWMQRNVYYEDPEFRGLYHED